MKERINHLVDSFVDYKGAEHKFVIVAVSQILPKVNEELEHPEKGYVGCEVFYEVNVYLDEYGTLEYMGHVGKVLKLGIAICNPEDKFNEKTGYYKALGRARNSKCVLYADEKNPGIINSTMVEALLKQEAEYIKNNPAKYIKGYKEAEEKYIKEQEMEELHDNFSSLEEDVLDALSRDPEFFDDVYAYLGWAKNRSLG